VYRRKQCTKDTEKSCRGEEKNRPIGKLEGKKNSSIFFIKWLMPEKVGDPCSKHRPWW
jgi:hypothetical protein